MFSLTTDWHIYRLSLSLLFSGGRGMERVPSQLIWPLLIYLVPARTKERRERRGLAPIISLQRVLSIVGRSVRFPNTNEEKNSTGNKFSGNSIYLFLTPFCSLVFAECCSVSGRQRPHHLPPPVSTFSAAPNRTREDWTSQQQPNTPRFPPSYFGAKKIK